MSAKENISRLPNKCFGIEKRTNNVIIIVAGESGFYPHSQDVPKGYHVEEFINELNESIGITVAERSAMEFGSCFGWDIPLADPDNYNEDGSYKL